MIDETDDSGTSVGGVPTSNVTALDVGDDTTPGPGRRERLLAHPFFGVGLAVLTGVLVLVALGLLFSPRYWRF
jgi:hypothetical protein